jgi:hypothetical protein
MALSWRTLDARIKQVGLLVTVGLFVIACNRNDPPTATPIPLLPTVTATAIIEVAASQPTFAPTFGAGGPSPESPGSTPGSSSGIATQGAIFTSPRYSYTVVLPCCWLALPTPGTAIESALAELQAESELPVWGDLSERVQERATGAVLELVALLPDEENATLPVAQVTVSVLPAYGLTLDDYLVATADELNSIANTNVLTAHIEPTLGVGAFPASLIEYTAVPTPATSSNSEHTMAGLQVAFFGHDANTLIVLTFTTTTDRFAELQPEFLHIVRTVTLFDPTV